MEIIVDEYKNLLYNISMPQLDSGLEKKAVSLEEIENVMGMLLKNGQPENAERFLCRIRKQDPAVYRLFMEIHGTN